MAALSGEERERTCAALGLAWRWAKLIFARGRLAYCRPGNKRLDGAEGVVAELGREVMKQGGREWKEVREVKEIEEGKKNQIPGSAGRPLANNACRMRMTPVGGASAESVLRLGDTPPPGVFAKEFGIA
jgi:hypothetical protein